MKIVISALHFAWGSMDQCLGRARDELGLDGVELSWHESYQRAHCTREDLAALDARRGQHGLALTAHVWGDLAQTALPDAQAWLLGWLPWCAQTGAQGLIIHGGTSPDRRAGIAHTKRVLEGVLPEFERQAVVLYLENHYAYDYHACHELFSEPWEFREVLAINSPSLRFCFDTGHGNMTHNTRELLDELAPWLAYVHLADNRGVDDDHLAYEQGTVRWADVFTQLRANSFDGTFCVEFPVYADEFPFRRCVADLRRRWA